MRRCVCAALLPPKPIKQVVSPAVVVAALRRLAIEVRHGMSRVSMIKIIMSKTPRISVPITPETAKKLKQLSAENGRSLAANFAELAQAGAANNGIAQQLEKLTASLSNSSEQRNEQQTQKWIAEFKAEVAEGLEKLAAVKSDSEGIFIPAEGFLYLFEETFFSAFLSSSIIAEATPGSTKQTPSFHLQNARQKAKGAVKNFLDKCGG